MNFTYFLSVLRARWKVCMTVLCLTVGTTVLISLFLPKMYVANAVVVVEFRPDPVAGGMMQGMLPAAYMATQTDILNSRRVAQRVIRNLNLLENEDIKRQWAESSVKSGSMELWLVDAIQRNLNVTPSRESSVIDVAYSAKDPQFAAAMANAFVQAFVDTSLEMRTNPAKTYTAFFDARSKELRDALEKAQERLSSYQREKGIVATDERLDVENARLSELSTQLVMIQALSAESSSRSAQAGGASADRLQEVLNNPVIGGLKADLARAEARLKELNSRLGDNHPQVIEARASISEIRARLDGEVRRVTGGVGVANAINRQREAEIRAALEAQRARVLKLKSQRDEVAVMQRDVENAQKAYETVVGRLNQSTLESQTTKSDIMALSQAEPPTKASSPKIVLNGVIAFFLGSFLAVGVALLFESMDRKLRVNEDVFTAVGIPVIGVMPKPNHRVLVKGRNRMPSLPHANPARLTAPEQVY